MKQIFANLTKQEKRAALSNARTIRLELERLDSFCLATGEMEKTGNGSAARLGYIKSRANELSEECTPLCESIMKRKARGSTGSSLSDMCRVATLILWGIGGFFLNGALALGIIDGISPLWAILSTAAWIVTNGRIFTTLAYSTAVRRLPETRKLGSSTLESIRLYVIEKYEEHLRSQPPSCGH